MATGLPIELAFIAGRDGLRDRPGRRRRHLQAAPDGSGTRHDGRRGEPPQRRHRAGPVRHRPGGPGAALGCVGRGDRVRRRDLRQRRHRAHHRLPCGAGGQPDRRPPHRADGLGDPGLRELPARGRLPPFGRPRHGHGRGGVRQHRAGTDLHGDGRRRDRHGLGVPRLPADRRRVPRRRPRHPARPAARLDRAHRLGRGRGDGRARDHRLRAARWRRPARPVPRASTRASRRAGCMSSSGADFAARSRWRWPFRSRRTSPSAMCCRPWSSVSSCSRCSCRGPPWVG